MAGKVMLCHDSLCRDDRFIYEAEEKGGELCQSSGLAAPAILPASPHFVSFRTDAGCRLIHVSDMILIAHCSDGYRALFQDDA